jgi:hypothetical protein
VVQVNNDEQSSDKVRQLANQQEGVRKVLDWLRQEGLEPKEITHLRKDACYYGVVVISNEPENEEQRGKYRREAFHILFPIDKPDSLTISEIIILDLASQKAYASLATKTNGALEQHRFYSYLERDLLEKNLNFTIKKDIQELKSFEIYRVLSFDQLTKDILFDSISILRNSIETVRTKTDQLRHTVMSYEPSPTHDYRS